MKKIPHKGFNFREAIEGEYLKRFGKPPSEEEYREASLSYAE